ncbi:MAG TPA: hypothetical protein VK279_15550 [Solirubrobacteraceae bacterium]|nr:hypothetical protein [Solirubrobacteraceae bacterium]
MRKPLIAALTGVVALSLAATAQAQVTQNADIKFTSKKPGSSTGIIAALRGERTDPQVKIPGATKIVVAFPSGTKFNTDVPGLCRANGQQVQQSNGSVCPRNSRVGTGNALADATPVIAAPVSEQIIAFNRNNGIFFYLQGLQTAVLTSTVRGNKLTTVVPPFPLPGGGVAALTDFTLRTRPVKKSGKNWITTPKSCPSSGAWTSTTTFTYATAPTDIVTSTTPCTR